MCSKVNLDWTQTCVTLSSRMIEDSLEFIRLASDLCDFIKSHDQGLFIVCVVTQTIV